VRGAKLCFLCQAECLVETQARVYDRFLSGMMAKDKKQEETSEQPDEDDKDDDAGKSVCDTFLSPNAVRCTAFAVATCLCVSR